MLPSSKLTWLAMEIHPFLIGNTSSCILDFPASYVGLAEGKNKLYKNPRGKIDEPGTNKNGKRSP